MVQQQQQQQQQHRIYILQFRKGEPEQEVSCKVSPPKGGGRRVMYYYQDYGGDKNGKSVQSRALSLRRFLAMLLLSFLCVGTLFVAPVSFLSFVHTDDGGAEPAAATATATRGGALGPCSAVGNDSICCDRTSERADICFARGDVRMHTASASFQLVSAGGNSTAAAAAEEEERIRPYTRKWEANVMATIDEVRLRRISPGDASAARCDVRHDVPALVFSTGGYTGNVYHEFNDGILPLFVTAHHLRRRVVLVILEYHDWWITKYGDVVSRLSAFPPIDFAADRRVHCFPEVIAGLRIHGELTVDPARTPEGKSIADFRRLLDDAYRGRIEFLERRAARTKRHRHRDTAVPRAHLSPPARRAAARHQHQEQEDSRPRLVIVSRTGSRVIENEAEVAAMAAGVGFDVRMIRPDRTTELCKIYRELNASDAMVGVHGAAMTHFLFMRPGNPPTHRSSMWSAAARTVSPLPAPSLSGRRQSGRATVPVVRSTVWDFVGGDLVRPDLGQWLDDVEKHKALAIYPPHEGGYEGRYLNRLKRQGYHFLDLSARGLGDPETTLTKIHPVCPPSLGRQPVARWYFPPEVDYRLSLLHPDAKGLVVWIIEAKVLSKAELQFLAMLPDLRPKVRVIAECGNWRKFVWKPLKQIAGLEPDPDAEE